VAEVLSARLSGSAGGSHRHAGGRQSLGAFLRACLWFPLLPPLAQERVLVDCYEESFDSKSIVAQQGDFARSWIGVIDGLLKVDSQSLTGRPVMFCAVPYGAWIGEGTVIKKERRRYEIAAMRRTVVAHMPRATLMWLLETNNDFCRFMIDHLNERLGQFIGSTELLRIDVPAVRVAAAICNLFHPILCPTALPVLKISQEEVGELAGLSRATTNGALKRLVELDLLRVEYGGLLIMDLSALRLFSESAATRAL
jgi:CRP/FNR family cyclic AMP-dependent transcriptional regulator